MENRFRYRTLCNRLVSWKQPFLCIKWELGEGLVSRVVGSGISILRELCGVIAAGLLKWLMQVFSVEVNLGFTALILEVQPRF